MPVKLIKTGNTIESVIEVRVFRVVEGVTGGLETADEINDLSLIWAELREFFDGNDGLIDEWLKVPAPALSGADYRGSDTQFGPI